MEINELPPELLVNIFHYLDQLELVKNISHVCPYWRSLKNSAPLWLFTDLNQIFIEEKANNKSSKPTHDFIKGIIDILPIVQHLKISPEMLLDLKQKFDGIMKNLRWLELTPTCVMSPKIFKFVLERCPNIRRLELKFLMKEFSVFKPISNDFNVDELSITHQNFCMNKKRYSEKGHSKTKRSTAEIEIIQHLLTTSKNLQICSWSFDFISFVIEKACSNIVCLKALGTVMDDKILLSLSQKAENLTELHLDFSRTTDEGLNEISKTASNLKLLSLQFCDRITDRGVSGVTRECKSLQQLYISNPYINSTGYRRESTSEISLAAVSEKCSSLTTLSIQNFKKFDEVRLSKITHSLCLCLTSISFNRCLSFFDNSLQIIAENCPALRFADFSQCPEITLDGVWTVMIGCHKMTHLSLLGCQKLTEFHPQGGVVCTQEVGGGDSQKSDSGISNVASGSRSHESGGSMSHESKSGVLNELECGLPSKSNVCSDKDQNILKKEPVSPSKIKVLNLAYCDDLNVASLSRISGKCQLLETLILRCCREDTEDIQYDVLQSIFSNCLLLKAIYVGWAQTIYRQDAEDFFHEHSVYPSWTVKYGLSMKITSN